MKPAKPLTHAMATAVMVWLDLSTEEWETIPVSVHRKLWRALCNQPAPVFTGSPA